MAELVSETSAQKLTSVLELIDLTTKASYMLSIRWAERKVRMEFQTTPTAFGRTGGACLPEKARVRNKALSEAAKLTVFPFAMIERGKSADVIYEMVPDVDAIDPLSLAVRKFLAHKNTPDDLVSGIIGLMKTSGFGYSVSVTGSPYTGVSVKIYRVGAKNRARGGGREW